MIPEGNVDVTYTLNTGTYADGTSYELRIPIYTFKDLGYGALRTDIMYSPRLAQQIPGLGLLEAVSESTILGFAASNASNGISGKANYVFCCKQQCRATRRAIDRRNLVSSTLPFLYGAVCLKCRQCREPTSCRRNEAEILR